MKSTKISRTPANLSIAAGILGYLKTGTSPKEHHAVSVTASGTLLFYPADCKPSEGEKIIVKEFTHDCIGSGWKSEHAIPLTVIEVLETAAVVDDVFREYGIVSKSDLASALYSEAYADGHSAGESEVLIYLRKYCELLKSCGALEAEPDPVPVPQLHDVLYVNTSGDEIPMGAVHDVDAFRTSVLDAYPVRKKGSWFFRVKGKGSKSWARF